MKSRTHTIGLLLASAADRRLLARSLRQSGFDVCAPDPGKIRPWIWEGVDLVILDTSAAAGEQGLALLALKQKLEAAFLPLLVVKQQKNGGAHWLRMGFDDVLDLPLRKAETTAKLKVFLRLRDQSRELSARNRRLVDEQLRYLSSQLLAALEDEKKWIAQELHDSIGQTLAAIKFGLEKKLKRMDLGSAPPGFTIEDVIAIVQNSIDEVRRIMMDLRPSILDDLGVLASVNWFCREFQKIYSDIRIENRIGVDECEIPDSLKLVIYRVLQEALNNIAKHSKASLVRLSLEKRNGTIELAIRDNGTGFILEEAFSRTRPCRGLGLGSMRHRTELSGGTLRIETGTGAGTVIRAFWPC
jgi:signal transduction histidine kinase